ncbi:MAG: hypothetical protein MZV49_08715 [Rhodopseudomonas palustris]|nr:hypothetical protein [Rhodopseudomonas palustris]
MVCAIWRRRGAGAARRAGDRGHRLGRQDLDQGRCCARRCAGRARSMPPRPRYNNHWGVPLTLARMPADARFRRDRDRHEPPRRDRAAGASWRGRIWRSSPRSPPPISRRSTASTAIAEEKAAILEGLEPGGRRRCNCDLPISSVTAGPRARGPAALGVPAVTFGQSGAADWRALTDVQITPDGRDLSAPRSRRPDALQGADPPGRHFAAERAGGAGGCRTGRGLDLALARR